MIFMVINRGLCYYAGQRAGRVKKRVKGHRRGNKRGAYVIFLPRSRKKQWLILIEV